MAANEDTALSQEEQEQKMDKAIETIRWNDAYRNHNATALRRRALSNSTD